MTDQEALAALKTIIAEEDKDWEEIHVKADRLLCSLLEREYPNLIREYQALTKWYS
jgi:hypothetical protein